MDRLNVFGFYTLGMHVHPLSEITGGDGRTLGDIYLQAIFATRAIRDLLDNEILDLSASREVGSRLLALLAEAAPPNMTPSDREEFLCRGLDTTTASRIVSTVKEFETLLANELPRLDVYSVRQTLIYSTPDLIERAELALETEARDILPKEALVDFNQAGRCLAFELPTAAAFHTMRSVEGVLRLYHSLVVKLPPGAKSPELGQCITELRSHGQDARVLDILEHIRSLHRNTSSNPEAFLSMKESLRLFDIAKSAIGAMSDRIAAMTGAAPKSAAAAVA